MQEIKEEVIPDKVLHKSEAKEAANKSMKKSQTNTESNLINSEDRRIIHNLNDGPIMSSRVDSGVSTAISGDQLVYPTINIYSSPRVFQQRIHNDRIPLLKYKERIYANNRRKSYELPTPDPLHLGKFNKKDGIIYNMRDIRGKSQNIGPIKILICICMYNESRNAINLTLNGIYENLVNFQSEGYSDGDIAVVLIQDGILKLVADRVKRTYAKGEDSMVYFYDQMDYFEGKPKCDLAERINVILDENDNYTRKGMEEFITKNTDFPPSIEKNISLLYQNLWHPAKTKVYRDDDELQSSMISSRENEKRRLRVFSCFKHTNGTKLSSHLWFFEGFCRYIQPKYCVLLDVGTKPEEWGIVNLIRGFTHKDIGGVTGFMSVDSNFKSEEGGGEDEEEQGWFRKNFFSIEQAQQYEYIIAHFLDKNAESALGFLHVLPGAWSAYRYKALIKSDQYEPNLLERSYFKMILNPQMEEKDFMEANMYLAEDRILSLGIYCQMDCQYLLKYVPDAVAYTDPMKTHKDLMTQRRRWINSSLFAFLYVFRNYYVNVMDSSHNFFRRYITLNISMIIALLSLVNSYFTPALYFFILYATVLQIGGYGTIWEHLAKVVSLGYIVVYMIAVGGGLTGKAWTDKAHIISYIMTGFTILLLILVVYNVLFVYVKLAVGSLDFTDFYVISLVVMLFANLFSFIILLVMHAPTHFKFLWRLIVDSSSYLAFQGAYAQTMVAHSFCNVDDVSWGTKGGGHTGAKKYASEKVFFVSEWLFYNAIMSFIFLYVDIIMPGRTGTSGGWVLITIAIYGATIIMIKTSLAIWYHIKWIIFEKLCGSVTMDLERKDKIDEYWRRHQSQWLDTHPVSIINQ